MDPAPTPGPPAAIAAVAVPEETKVDSVVPAQAAHLEPDAAVLPLGSDVHPDDQAEAIEKVSQEKLAPEVEKVKAEKRERVGEPPKGTVVRGIEDDKLWALLRRFNVQVSHTLSPPTKLPAGEPDLRPTTLPSVPFTSDELKSNVERVYASAGVGGIIFVREMGRLMSWSKEDRLRTAMFCIAYFVSAFFSLVIPAIMALLILLVTVPRSRYLLFPPATPQPGIVPSATDPSGKKGDETLLAGVEDPVVHRSKAEQVEQQAWEFTNTVQRFGIRVVMGGKSGGHQGNGQVGRKSGEAEDSSEDDDDDDEEDEGAVAVYNHDNAGEKDTKELTPKQRHKLKAKEARQKRDAMVGNAARAAQDGLGAFADLMEVFYNALSPPAAYPHNEARFKLAGAILAPILIVTAIVPAHVWAQVISISFGIGFFGQPLLLRAAKKFVKLVPDWQEKIDMRNSLLSKVPTNAQLVLHILRERERMYDPLPSPPAPPSSKIVKDEMTKSGVDPEGGDIDHPALDGSGNEGDAADDKGGEGLTKKVAKKSVKTMLSGLKVSAKKAATFRADVTVDGTREKVGSKLDRLFYQSKAKDLGTPESFPAKLHGTSGQLVIRHFAGTPPTLDFVPLRSLSEKASFRAPIEDLVEIKKKGVFIARTILGWAASINLEGMGLEMRFKGRVERSLDEIGEGDNPHDETHEGDMWSFSHVGRRDELFNRLISIGQQKWETL